jgi:hypothetical protein
MAHFCLTREEAMSLADNIANALEVCRQDSPEVLPPYPEEHKLPKGWVYNMAEVKEEDHASPSLYTMPCCPLTRTMRTEVLKHRADPYRQLCRGMKTTKGQVMSLSPF